MSITTPDQVAFETPRGNPHIGTVVEREERPNVHADERHLLLVVEYQGHRYRVDESECTPV